MRLLRLFGIFLLPALLAPQSGREKRVAPVDAGQRQSFDRQPKIAILVGISAYPEGSGLSPLKYAAADVDDLAAELTRQGYAVRQLKDSQATRGVVTRTLNQVGDLLDPDQGTLLFYFSGHGFAQNGVNYLATFGVSVDDLQRDGLPLPEVEQLMKRSKAKRQVLWVDACRNDAQNGARTAGAARSFAKLDAAEGLRVLYSTRAGSVSYEDDTLRHGVFTYFLLKGLRGEAAGADGLLTFQDLAGYVSDSVLSYGVEKGRPQRPFEAGEASGDFLLGKVAVPVSAITPPPPPVTRVVESAPVGGTVSANIDVSFDRIAHSEREPQNWLTYSGNTLGQRYSQLTQITSANVSNLAVKWSLKTGSKEKFEATPLVVDGVMFTVLPPNDAVAIEAATGRVLWKYSYQARSPAALCCGQVNRGLAILGDKLLMGTIDAHLLALSVRDGRLLWDTRIGDAGQAYSITQAPLVVKGMVVVGVATGHSAAPGYLSAVDATTGKMVWQFHTTPTRGEYGYDTWPAGQERRGGAAPWMTGSYDPELNLLYWGMGSPAPRFDGDSREGINLFSNTLLALDADTGRRKFHFQVTHHDQMDWDSAQVPVLTDLMWQGRLTKAVMWANANGVFYMFDRVSGMPLTENPFVKLNWKTFVPVGISEATAPGLIGSGNPVYPGVGGATSWNPPSFSPRTGLFYVAARDEYWSAFMKGGDNPEVQSSTPTGALIAIDSKSGKVAWKYNVKGATTAGVLTTASDILFTGGGDGTFFASDARTGKLLWSAPVAGAVVSGPMTYAVGGRQFVAVAAGDTLYAFGLRGN